MSTDRVQTNDGTAAAAARSETEQRLFEAAYESIEPGQYRTASGASGSAGSDQTSRPDEDPILKPIVLSDGDPDRRQNGSGRPRPDVRPEPASATLNAGDLRRLFEKNLPRLDIDNDNHVSELEIDKALNDATITGADAQMLAELKRNRAALADLSKDTNSSKGISLNDMKELESAKIAELALNYAKERASSIDRNGDGELSQSEIKQFGDAEQDVDKKKLLEVLSKATERLPIKVEDLDYFLENKNLKLAKQIDRNLATSGNQLKVSSDTLYGPGNPIDSIKPEAIKQGMAGDCEFLAALTALAKNDPESIKNMIKSNPDGTYTVTFPGDPNRPITVEKPTDAELALYAAPGENGIWPAVLEKAYGRGRYMDYWPGGGTDQDNTTGPSLANIGMRVLTGKDVEWVWMTSGNLDRALSLPQLEDRLKRAIREGKPITADINFKATLGRQENEIGLPAGHVYTVLGYDEKTGMVKIRNPWGNTEPNIPGRQSDGVNDGVFELTLAEFEKYFLRMNIGK